MNLSPRVSIVINNYNYEPFLADAIESSLQQTYSNVEVIIVDDGSTDRSADVIQRYEPNVIPIFKPNGGQASAFNAGFRQVTGEIVMFLDSDDMLLPSTVEQVVTAFHNYPNAAKVQYRLQVVDRAGIPTGETVPPLTTAMPTGDVKPEIARYGNYCWTPTSGNAYRTNALAQILPMPEDTFRAVGDGYTNMMSVLYGDVVSLDVVGAYYRVHGGNIYRKHRIDLDSMSYQIAHRAALKFRQQELAQKLHGLDLSTNGTRDLNFLIHKIVLLKLSPDRYPLNDTLRSMCWHGAVNSIVHCDYHWSRKLILFLWFIAAFFAPRSFVEFSANQLFYQENRGQALKRVLNLLRGVG